MAREVRHGNWSGWMVREYMFTKTEATDFWGIFGETVLKIGKAEST